MKFLVLLSAGLDSSVNLYKATREGSVEMAITFDYGQRARDKEISKAKEMAQSLGIKHQVVELPFFKFFGKSSLVDHDKELPKASAVQINDAKVSEETAKSVWVPNRNGIFLNVAAGFAEALGVDAVVPGFNKEEAETFPDNSESFIAAMTQSLSYSTANHVQVKCFTSGLDKTEIVKLGLEIGVNWKLVWPCYQSQDAWCGECESCQRAQRAFAQNQIDLTSMWRKI